MGRGPACSKAVAERGAEDQFLLTFQEIEIHLGRDLPVSHLEAVLAADAHQALAAMLGIFDARADPRLPATGAIGKRQREYIGIDISERSFRTDTDAERLLNLRT